MKTLIFALFTGLVWGAVAFAASPMPQSTCFPSTPEAKAWPIKVVYLHGLFAASGDDTFGFRRLENANRAKLLTLATRLHVRIAAPVSPSIGRGQMREWNQISLAQIESLARKACDGGALASGRSLVGFSNGGYAARRIGVMPCDQNSAYRLILAIGAPDGTTPGRCQGQLTNLSLEGGPHALPDAFINKALAQLGQRPTHVAAASAAPTVSPNNYDDEPGIGR